MNVAVTAVGGGVGQSIIKCLHKTLYSTVGIDPKSDAAGLYMADTGCIGLNVTHKNYINKLIDICKKQECRFLFPGLDSELMLISRNYSKFVDAGITPIISKPGTIEISDNKWKLYEFLSGNGLPHIKTATSVKDAGKIKFPWVLKPMVGGCRSRNIHVCYTPSEAQNIIDISEDKFIIQEYIDGQEFTCGSVTFDRNVLGTIIMERTLRDGDTYKAYVRKHLYIDRFLHKLLPLIGPFGPCNIQLRLRDGIPYVLEINARCSGTTAARALAGFNEPLITCNHLLGKKTKFNIREIAILRYWNECAVEYGKREEIENEGFIHRG